MVKILLIKKIELVLRYTVEICYKSRAEQL